MSHGIDRRDLDAAIELVVIWLGEQGHELLARTLAVATDPQPEAERAANVAELAHKYGLADLSETPRALDLGRLLLWFGRTQPECVRAAARGQSSAALAELLESAIGGGS
jgi:hypothetical protein